MFFYFCLNKCLPSKQTTINQSLFIEDKKNKGMTGGYEKQTEKSTELSKAKDNKIRCTEMCS